MALVTSATCFTFALAVTLLLTSVPSKAAMIFPEDDYGVNFMAKRQINPDCYRCLFFDPSYSGACLRCWGARFGAVVPFYSKRSAASDEVDSLAFPEKRQANWQNTGVCICCQRDRSLNGCCALCMQATKRFFFPNPS